MFMDFNLTIGMKAEKTEKVTENNTAIKYGSGGVAVYATPAMIGLMEATSLAVVDSCLPEDTATVGIDLKIKHLAATPVGMTIKVIAELIQVDGRRLVFHVIAFDDREKIGEGTHERFIITKEKFLQKAEAKKA
jgi:fluoroacetyl-CoA thioesterase